MKITSNLTKFFYSLHRVTEHFLWIRPWNKINHSFVKKDIERLTGGKHLPIAEVFDITPEEFRAKYLKSSSPVILRGFAKNWDCCKKWSPDYFIETYGDKQLAVMNNIMEDREFNVEDLTMKKFMQAIKRGETTKYLRFCSLKYTAPELIDDFDVKTVSKFIKKPVRITRNNSQVFIGASGTHTMLHAAPPHNFFVQIYGTKNWRIYHPDAEPIIKPGMDRSPFYASHFSHKTPDLDQYPGMEKLDYYDFDLHPGDVLYNPPSYWHLVSNKSISIAVAFRWMDLNCFKVNFTQMLLLLFALNPTLLFSIRNKKNYANHFKYLERKHKKS